MSFWSRIGDALKATGDALQNGIALAQGNTVGLTGGSAATPGNASFGDEIRGVYADTVSKHGLIDDQQAKDWHVAGHLSGNFDLTTPEGWGNEGAAAAGVMKPLAENSFTGPVLQKMGEVYQKVDQGLGAIGLYDAAAHAEGNTAFLDFSASAWKKAWDAADPNSGFGPNGFALLNEGANRSFEGANNPFVNQQAAKDLKNRYVNSWDGIAAGVADTIALGVVDPLAAAGAVAKGSRVATKLSSTIKANEVATRLNAATSAADATAGIGTKLADTAKGTFGGAASVEGNTSALYKAMASTHGQDALTLRDHYSGLLEHTGQSNSMPILDLMGRAGKIADPHEQAITKGNILLAARGSEVARAELIKSAPQLAAGLQRVSSAPTYFAHLDDLAVKVASQPGYNLGAVRQAAERLDNTPENKAELLSYIDDLDKVQAHFDKLDSFGGYGANAGSAQNAVEIGMTALDRAKASMRKRTSFVYQNGNSGATVTVLRWSTRDRNMGFVNVAEPMVGVDHLTSELKSTGLYSPQEIRDRGNAFIGAGNQQGRQQVAEGVLDDMVTRLGAKHGLSRKEVDQVTSDLQAARVHANEYLSAAAANAAKDQRTITFSDPGWTSHVAVDRALLETHIRDAVVIPPVDELEKIIKQSKGEWSMGDRASTAAGQVDEKLQSMTSLWRFMVLARPGLAVRAMADTGLRSIAMVGAANLFLSSVHGIADQARRLGSDSPRIAPLDAAGRLRVESLTTEANALRKQAETVVDPKPIIPDPVLPEPVPAWKGGPTLYHGTSRRFAEDKVASDPWGGSGSGNLFGYGFYSTDHQGIAESYRMKGRTAGPDQSALYNMQWTGDKAPKVLNLEKSHNKDLRKYVDNELNAEHVDWDPDLVTALRAKLADKKVSDREVLLDFRNTLRHTDMTTVDADEIYAFLAEKLADKGWDAIAHVGGVNSKSGIQHNVTIFLDPGKLKANHHAPVPQAPIPPKLKPGERADMLRARADRLEEQAQQLQMQGQQFRADRKSATKGVKLRLNGETHYVRAFSDEANLKGIEKAVVPGGHQLHEIIAPVTGNRVDKLSENADNWITSMPDDRYWTESYIRSMDALRNSYTGKRVLTESGLPDTHDMLTSLRKDARVRAEWQQVKEAHPSLNAWIEDMVNLADFHAPTHEVRQALLGARVTPETVNSLFNDANGVGGKLDRMPVNAPAMSHALPKGADVWKNGRDKLYRNLLDKPDIHLVRMPLYKAKFADHAQAQVAALGRDGARHLTGEDLARIEANARHRAIQDVRQSMVNTMRSTGAMGTMRVIAPFLSPWQDAMESWGRLMYDNPAVAGAWLRYWQLPAQAGLVVDQDGQIIKPWEDTASEGKTKMINIPLPKGVQGFTGLESVRLRQDSLNSAFQGEVPWLPGFGPFVQVPVGQMIGHLMPELGDSKNPMLRSLFPFGLPEGSNQVSSVPGQLGGQFVPAWLRAIKTGLDHNSAEFGRAYSTALNGNIVDFTNKHGRKPNAEELVPLQGKARGAVKSALVLKGVVLGMFGMSVTNNPRGQFYVEQMHQLYALEAQLQAKGYTVTEAFNTLFPEAADMKWTATENPTGITYTMKAENAARQFKDKINRNPAYGWFYAGTDNVMGPNDPYSPTANALQKGELYGPKNEHRRTLSPDEQDRKAEAEMGWAEYQKFSTAAQVELEKRGLHSMAQRGAADIQALRLKLRAELFTKYPAFGDEYNANAGSVINKFEPVLADALKDPRLKNRSDVRAIAQYMALRQQTLDLLKNNKGRSADLKDPRNADVAEYLRQQGEVLSRQNLGFQQAWQRIFSREVEN